MVVKAIKLKIHNRGSCGELVDHSYGIDSREHYLWLW